MLLIRNCDAPLTKKKRTPKIMIIKLYSPRAVVPSGGSTAPGGRLLASGGRCKGRGAVVGVEKRGGAE